MDIPYKEIIWLMVVSGVVESDSKIITPGLSVGIGRSGRFNLDVEAQKLETVLSGSGTIRIEGDVDSNKIILSGFGEILLHNLSTNYINVLLPI